MKTIKSIRAIFIILMLVCISGISSYATNPPATASDQLQTVIKQGLTYPDRAVRECCTGSVDVIFTVDADGKIKNEKTFADNAHVERMVKDQLASISCKGVETALNEQYKITITFKLIG